MDISYSSLFSSSLFLSNGRCSISDLLTNFLPPNSCSNVFRFLYSSFFKTSITHKKLHLLAPPPTFAPELSPVLLLLQSSIKTLQHFH
jgi:hypothetical protein